MSTLEVCREGVSTHLKNKASVKLDRVRVAVYLSASKEVLLYTHDEPEPYRYFGRTTFKQFMTRYGEYFVTTSKSTAVTRASIKGIRLLGTKKNLFEVVSNVGVELEGGVTVGLLESRVIRFLMELGFKH